MKLQFGKSYKNKVHHAWIMSTCASHPGNTIQMTITCSDDAPNVNLEMSLEEAQDIIKRLQSRIEWLKTVQEPVPNVLRKVGLLK